MTDLPPGLTPLLDREALAKVLGLSPKTILRLSSQDPQRLPPRVRAMSVLRWDPAAVRAWLTEQSAPPRRVGRPRKA